MKTENNNNLNPENMQELNLEEMEDVTGGGIKEIVAATTLAAMAMTGNTVSAFGLANALAEDAAHIEEAPAQEAYGMEYMGELASEIEIGNVDAEVGEYSDALGDVDAAFEAAQLAAQQELPEAEIPMDEEIPEAETLPEEAALPEVETVAEEQLPVVETSEDEAVAGEATEDIVEAPTEEAPEAAVEEDPEAIVEEASETPVEAIVEAQPEATADEPAEVIVEVAEIDKVPANAIEDVDAAAEAVVEAVDVDFGEASGEEAAVGEVEFDFAGEDAPAMLEEDAEDKDALMAAIIETAVDARRDEGLYAALDTAFATLAENADALANPKTGVIDTDGNRIVNMTYDALASRFDNTPEQLMGAIGAAAYRADAAGYIQTLGGDPALVSMAANEAAKSSPISGDDIAKASLDLTLDGLSAICPAFGPFSGFFKSLAGPLMGGGTNIEAEFKALQNQISAAEKSLKQNTYNVVQLGSIDNRFVDLNARTTSLQSKIADITESHKLSDAQKLQKLADLIDSGELRELTNAVNAATECFTSTQVDELANRNLFEAAYQRACGEVMFSGEALDMTVPYLTRQLASYTQACATMAQIYNAYEQVYGAGSLNGSRGLMIRNITGCDLNGNHVQDSVFDLFKDYVGRSRFVFVNKDSKGTGIEVSQELGMITLEKGEKEDKKLGKTGLSVLSTDQVKDITEYSVKTRGVCLHDYLANKVGFKMDENSVKKTTRKVKGLFPGSGETIKKEVLLTGGDKTGYLYWFGYDFWNKSTDKQIYTTGIGGKGLTVGAMTDMTILYFKKA